MCCILCGGNTYCVRSYDYPDKYQGLISNDGDRHWFKCNSCGVYSQVNSLVEEDLEKIYEKYRDMGLRGKTIRDTFVDLIMISQDESENLQRLRYFSSIFDEENKILDIGSGLGVFPFVLDRNGYNVKCIEPNKDSLNFINSIGMECFDKLEALRESKFDIVSIVHVLEHIKQPINFLKDIEEYLKPDGKLFIEVPHSEEFNYLPKDHDEFNSLHYFFYDLGSINLLLESVGFNITYYKKMYYKQRSLIRCIIVAERSTEYEIDKP